jgi:hypothetical protein
LYFTVMISRMFLRAFVLNEFFLILLPIPKTLTFSFVGSNPKAVYIKYFLR